ncbi:M20/M25/M40 family metallo-hydrolase [Novosphingobium sp. TH158]|uniref:M20/M25/M40 family metallo-hydrolase n=1 Tax=Novosphingobium sp. TH158 TaxID=2067455 RepID=UPI000C7A1ADE|nr:M20/M25/M40 family metallo-hydrolase [Novosphingobium sp. TH158]PLK25531.1 peptidase M28 [Novosphingobium sp. TH158]
MSRRLSTMSRLTLYCVALACTVSPVNAASRDRGLESALRQHINVLASNDFGGREPGTDGEEKTLRYLARQWFEMGLTSGTNDPGHEWFKPVRLVAREPAASAAIFTRKGRPLPIAQTEILMLTSGKRALVESAPLLFVGNGGGTHSRGELAGRVAVLLSGPEDDGKRQDALLKAGAGAVLTVLDGERTIAEVSARRKRSGYALASDKLGGDLEGFITDEAFNRLLATGGQSLDGLEQEARQAAFKPRPLDISATLEATTRETTIRTHNLIGKLPGRRPEAGAVLFLAHWDHFGECGDGGAGNVICNGAIDNASGLAALTETARRLVKSPQLDRDIYFLATTAEELGLLGAQAFAENPPIPLKSFVAAFNMDSVAIAPANTPLATVGYGMTKLDPLIAQVAKQEKRKIVSGEAANAYVKRQDGWALLQHDVPAVMVSSAYGDISRIEKFFDTDYHRPTDQAKAGIELGGAAQDVQFHVALGRFFGDVRKVPATVR